MINIKLNYKILAPLVVVIVFCLCSLYMLRKSNDSFIPSHAAPKNCSWNKKSFKEITLFEQKCNDSTNPWDLHENNNGTLLETDKTAYNFSFSIQLLNKDTSESPSKVINDWYSKLTPAQQKVCSIQNPDTPIEFFPNGEIKSIEGPHPTPHKTRFKIDVKKEVIDQIFNQYGGDPGGSPERDYMCGKIVGVSWGSYAPYFEFDDRSPGKYIFIGSYGQEGPMIDLNSIKF